MCGEIDGTRVSYCRYEKVIAKAKNTNSGLFSTICDIGPMKERRYPAKSKSEKL
jgi:hypothetical protein